MPPNQNQPSQNQVPPVNQPPQMDQPLAGYQNNMNIGQEGSSNGVAVAGFVLVMVSVVLSWIPVITTILWLVGIVLSIAGLSNANKGAQKKGLALSGVIVAVISGILYLGLAVLVLYGSEQSEESQGLQESQEVNYLH